MKAWTICVLLVTISGCGSGNEGPVVNDFFLEYYAECVGTCEEVGRWETGCGSPHAKMADDCVEHIWWKGYSQEQCKFTAMCYAAMLKEGVCLEHYESMKENGWYPPMFETGCPAQNVTDE